MAEFQSMEDKLNQLVPASLSEDGLERMDHVIDELALGEAGDHETAAGGDVDDQGTAGKSITKQGIWKAAAILVLLVLPAALFTASVNNEETVAADPAALPSGLGADMKLVKVTNRIDGSQDDGLIIPQDGSAPHHRYHYYVVDEEQLRDAATGIVVTVRQPRHEVITVPVTLF